MYDSFAIENIGRQINIQTSGRKKKKQLLSSDKYIISCKFTDIDMLRCTKMLHCTYLPLPLLLVLLTESELEERLWDPEPLRERAGRAA